jgi:hypothetical protein
MVSSRASLFDVTAVESSARLPSHGVCDKSAEKGTIEAQPHHLPKPFAVC